MRTHHTDVVIVGMGIAGIATAHALKKHAPLRQVTIVDYRPPLSHTTAQSGDNFRDWWADRSMKSLANRSIQLMSEFERDYGTDIGFHRNGYLLVTREKDKDALARILDCYKDENASEDAPSSQPQIRVHNNSKNHSYSKNCQGGSPKGIDLITNADLVRSCFPRLSPDITQVAHIRNAGHFSSNRLGTELLRLNRESGLKTITGKVHDVEKGDKFHIGVFDGNSQIHVESSFLVNCAGPFLNEISDHVGLQHPISNIFQQKFAFEDHLGAIERDLPFTIDLDEATFDLTQEERDFLSQQETDKWILQSNQGGVHCRPEGNGEWIKLGWAFNHTPGLALHDESPQSNPRFKPLFPEFVIRAASKTHPKLTGYLDALPTRATHYGGYYTMTPENRPLIGPTAVSGYYLNAAHSGFGAMVAMAAAELTAIWIDGKPRPDYASDFIPDRFVDGVNEHQALNNRALGIL